MHNYFQYFPFHNSAQISQPASYNGPANGWYQWEPRHGWLIWFIDCLGRAIGKANNLTGRVLAKDAFWLHLKEKSIEISERQKKIINLLLDGFEGKLTTAKWGKLTKTSHDTALREIQDLIEKRILKQEKAGGRSTTYIVIRENTT